jgi:hypothetical protein
LIVGIQVLIERIGKGRFRATSGEPLPASVEARTREAAVVKLKKEVGKRLQNGAELVSVDLGTSAQAHPLAEFAGMFKDDPLFDEVVEIMAENRRRRNADPDVP